MRSGNGVELPPVGEVWDDWLEASAASLFPDTSSLGWVRYLWSQLEASGQIAVGTDLEVARAEVRLVTLAVLRREVIARLDGDDTDDWTYHVENPGISPFRLGVLAGTDGVAPDCELGWVADREPQDEALVELVRLEAERVGTALLRELGASKVLALTWASRITGARYPLSTEATDEALNHGLTPEKHQAFEWVSEGMSL